MLTTLHTSSQAYADFQGKEQISQHAFTVEHPAQLSTTGLVEVGTVLCFGHAA